VRRRRNISGRKGEGGVIILLVAVFMLFVVGAMAALSIDVVTFYTTRSEAQLAADAAALAGARVLANSGMTTFPANPALVLNAETLAISIANQVATHNLVGGRNLVAPAEVTVTIDDITAPSNPRVTVQTKRTDVPTFFARILGSQQVTVAASATAEAYNPSSPTVIATPGGGGPPVAPICVKPWLLPNIDPTQTNAGGNPIFSPSGAIYNPSLVGQSWPNTTAPSNPNPNGLYALCKGDCSPSGGGITAPSPGAYYPGAAADFPAPTQALPACSNGFNAYQLAVAGCMQQPISCGVTSNINIDTISYGTTRDADTVQAAECLIHYTAAGDSDSIDPTVVPSPPFQFLAGNQNPIVLSGAMPAGSDVMVSDSIVTIPVINYPPGAPTPVEVIGFLQVFLNPQSTTTLPYPTPSLPAPPGSIELPATIINMAGCGNTVTGNPVFGNGASPVAVRLISPP